jgi:hypothetical protein
MSDHVIIALILVFIFGITLGVFGKDIWRRMRKPIETWSFRHKVIEPYNPTIKKEK